MALVLPIGFCLVQWQLTCEGDAEEMLTGMGFEIDTPPLTQANVDDIADLFLSPLTNLTNEYTLTGCKVRVGQDGDPLMMESARIVGTGGGGPSALPPNCAYLVQKKTALGGRRNRGRMYIPGVPVADVFPNGDLSSTRETDLQQSLDTMMEPASLEACNLSQGVVLHSTGGSAVPAPTPVTTLDVSNRIATQRRRLRP